MDEDYNQESCTANRREPLPIEGSRHALPRLVALAAVVLGAWRIGAAWTVFSQTYDEPFHIACGMEWLDRGEYQYELQHPPLAPVAEAAGPWLGGYHSIGLPSTLLEGNAILQERGDYLGALRRARAGNLLFYGVACLFLYLLARRCFGEAVAAWSTVLFAQLPPIIGHARLATTDMAWAAGLIVALYALDVWRERPDLWRGIGLGLRSRLELSASFRFFRFSACRRLPSLPGARSPRKMLTGSARYS